MICIYTDGSCLNNPGIGGWAFIIKFSDGEVSRWANSQKKTTNNEMELTAVIKALEYCVKHNIQDELEILTDSVYVKNGITKWIYTWIQNDWKTANKQLVKNKELWEILYNLSSQFNTTFTHVKAHANNVMNNKVDALANGAAHNSIISSLTESF